MIQEQNITFNECTKKGENESTHTRGKKQCSWKNQIVQSCRGGLQCRVTQDQTQTSSQGTWLFWNREQKCMWVKKPKEHSQTLVSEILVTLHVTKRSNAGAWVQLPLIPTDCSWATGSLHHQLKSRLPHSLVDKRKANYKHQKPKGGESWQKWQNQAHRRYVLKQQGTAKKERQSNSKQNRFGEGRLPSTCQWLHLPSRSARVCRHNS